MIFDGNDGKICCHDFLINQVYEHPYISERSLIWGMFKKQSTNINESNMFIIIIIIIII